MLNQSFSVENFRKIYDFESRRGANLDTLFFRDLIVYNDYYKFLSDLKNKIDKSDPKRRKGIFAITKRQQLIRKHKEIALTKKLDNICNELHNDFKFSIKKINANGKLAFSLDKTSACSYFAIKQLQYNIRKSYKVKQSNRDAIISLLSNNLKGSFPRIIVRADIKDFYETIPRKKILQHISSEPLLSMMSKQIIKQLLASYSALSGNEEGIPRGLGISAYLSEIYMRRFDKRILQRGDVIYYARYVDDIIAIFSRSHNFTPEHAFELIEKEAEILSLKVHTTENKKAAFCIPTDKLQKFDYLGYKFSIWQDRSVDIGLSDRRFRRYIKKIKLSYSQYFKSFKNGEADARLFMDRIIFLTSNTRLKNSKKNVIIGSYFSNRHLTDLKRFKKLDFILDYFSGDIPNRIVKRINQHTFVTGFQSRRFVKFNVSKIEKIVEAWKYVK